MVHLKCNNLNVADAEIIRNTDSDRFWICMFCSNNLFPFATLNDHKLYQTLAQSNNHYSGSSNSYSTHTCSTLKPPKNLSNLFNEFNNVSSQQNKNNKNIINCKYYNIKEIQSLYNLNHKNALNLFHINTCSLSKNIEELEYLLDKTAPSNVFDNGRKLTETQEIANALNKYFVNVATDIQSSIRY